MATNDAKVRFLIGHALGTGKIGKQNRFNEHVASAKVKVALALNYPLETKEHDVMPCGFVFACDLRREKRDALHRK